jgi:hypothetical protein
MNILPSVCTRRPHGFWAVNLTLLFLLLLANVCRAVSDPTHDVPGDNPADDGPPPKVCPVCGTIVNPQGSGKYICPECSKPFSRVTMKSVIQ